MGQMLVFAGADRAVEHADVDVPVRHRLDIFVFEVHGAGPEEDIGHLIHDQELLTQLDDRDLAPATGGRPVEA